MRKILLDTNVYGKYRGGDNRVFSYIAEADIVYLSTIVIGELISGFYGGSKYDRNRENLELFISKSTVNILTVGPETAEIYGEIKNELKKRGTPIPINDIWIAANTIEIGAKLVTYDKHFLNIQGLRLWEEIKR